MKLTKKTFAQLSKIADIRPMTDTEWSDYLDHLRERAIIDKRRRSSAKVHHIYKTFPINLN